jgi:hypothetical protein
VRQVADELGGRHDDRGAGAVVDRAGPLVPAVQVRAEQHELLRLAAAAHLGDDVLRVRARHVAGRGEQAHARDLAEGCDALELLGIRCTQGKGGQRHAAGDVGRRAGVREAMAVGAGRAHEERTGAGPGRAAGPSMRAATAGP